MTDRFARNLLAEFYSVLATKAFERHQFDLAQEYIHMVNQLMRDCYGRR